MIKRICIANRGEIAVRIMKTAHRLGIHTVAVYSDADKNALHVQMADYAVPIGPATPSASYLNMDKIIAVAKEWNCDAIHPGYGFLSENSEFAKKVADAEIIFIGPSPEAMLTMGNKLEAKAATRQYNIPLVPGYDAPIKNMNEALKVANSIGYPVLIKAAAGGGGKGMRIVEKADEFISQCERAQREALSSFGDDRVFLEKYIASPRHIEIQIMADQFGNVIHLNERECSIQRRHQKLIEEAPSSILSESTRTAMGNAAILVAKSCNYTGAGTVEFLLDENQNFYFLEMNTRLQVEHPVTECITGLDLVELQIRVAQGEKLPLQQSDVKIQGHAIELRINAEDALNDFLPATGTLIEYQEPLLPGVRCDSGYRKGMEVSMYYDPMIAKLIVHGSTRTEAMQLMLDAIAQYQIDGISTTIPFGRFVMEHPAFRSGQFDTHFVQKYFSSELLQSMDEDTLACIAAFSTSIHRQQLTKVTRYHTSTKNTAAQNFQDQE